MVRKQGILTVTSQKQIAESIYELKCEGPLVKQMTEPGQFVHLKIDEYDDILLRRPLSICDVNADEQTLTMLYRVEGAGTKRLAAKMSGMTVDVLGPLGKGFPVEETKSGEVAVLVGGGIGVPPLYYLSQKLQEKGVKVIHILGFQSKGAVFYEEEFQKLGPTLITTIDGSYGLKGFVTDAIREHDISFDTLYACGPNAMLQALTNLYPNARGFLSLEERMGCGIGACLACVCHLANDPDGASYKKVCTDGPVFRVGEVVL
ncbi:dihydroorotate dehydrogenase electron transfer subunit [Alkalihalobacillus pseudalcaliphilus]|uniref:dihydroorotate dehydrogenase electron transfer subunit n=1 Tax=Alkalihalobacillus pseudalcaliphilus TaxID=79884 RepID=UPI00064DD449|nr:dihydroorotate dehydrogenase electron transfer subunit [Alkalihalobacillus pseudalcaliphilus]KMK77144.1 dihydroorotate dehydrogenase [Alkalihalobacillus pseudalcaliphilus]